MKSKHPIPLHTTAGRIAVALTLLLATLTAGAALAAGPVNKARFSGVAIEGFDPVAYFTEGKPVKGDKRFSHQWQGATWRFASQQHLELFAAEPARYAPQYGGYCAWAVSQGGTAGIDPEAWKIVDDKLYLNYSKSIQAKWEEDVAGNIAKADANWPELQQN